MTKEREREAFERWRTQNPVGFGRWRYSDDYLKGQFQAWDAARATDAALIKKMVKTLCDARAHILDRTAGCPSFIDGMLSKARERLGGDNGKK